MAKELYNYKEVYETPFTVQKFTKNFSLNNPFPLAKIVIFVVTFFLLLVFFRKPIGAIGSVITGLDKVIYGGVPYLVSKYLMKLQPDGKRLHYYLKDIVLFFFKVKLPKKQYCHDKEVKHIQAQVVFEEVIVEGSDYDSKISSEAVS